MSSPKHQIHIQGSWLPALIHDLHIDKTFSIHKLINTKPNMHTNIPMICLMETFSLYKKNPTTSKTHARPMFATTLAVLTLHPARYTNTYPTSRPTNTNARTIDVQLTLDNSKTTFDGFTMKTNMIAVIFADTI